MAHNPRRVLTKPSKAAHNEGYDNEDYDYILYVNDWLGTDDGHKYVAVRVCFRLADLPSNFTANISFWMSWARGRLAKSSSAKI